MILSVPDNWQQRMERGVSPLTAGVAALQVNNFRPDSEMLERPGRTAAVLVPVIHSKEPAIVLTRRALHLAQHPGQVSFPGGSAEDEDDSAVTTALREAWEEIGLPPTSVTPLGFLDRFDTVSNYRVLPVVGLIQPPAAWEVDANEVAEVFTLPLAVALDRSRYEHYEFKRDGQSRMLHRMDWKGHNIWGLTAAMLLNLALRMDVH